MFGFFRGVLSGLSLRLPGGELLEHKFLVLFRPKKVVIRVSEESGVCLGGDFLLVYFLLGLGACRLTVLSTRVVGQGTAALLDALLGESV